MALVQKVTCDRCERDVEHYELAVLEVKLPDGRKRLLDLHKACCDAVMSALTNGAPKPDEERTARKQLAYFHEEQKRRARRAEDAIESYQSGANPEVLLNALRDEISEARR